MQKNAIQTLGVRAVTFALALLAALSATYWVLKSTQSSSVSIAAAVASSAVTPLEPKAVAKVLGGGKTAVPGKAEATGSTPFVLVGVLAEGSRKGAALIAVDGKPARPYAVGARVADGFVVQSVSGRRAMLAATADGPALVTLELPALGK
jgi:general secretion pathway protein C